MLRILWNGAVAKVSSWPDPATEGRAPQSHEEHEDLGALRGFVVLKFDPAFPEWLPRNKRRPAL